MDASFWGPMWRALDADAEAITPEFPGFGGAPTTEAPSIDGFADEVAATLRDDRAGAALVVGVSMGGYVAQSLAVRNPDVVAGLILANTRAEADDTDARRARDAGIDTIRIDGLDAFLDGLVPRLVSPDADAEVWERVQAIALRQDPEAVCSALEALRDRPDRTGDLAAIAAPAVVVVGEDDAITPRAAADALAAGIPGADQRVIGRCGHLSAIEQPAAFAAVVREVLARLRGGAG
jgi:pimeloyl-ACP methyl ester carboxylesterase